MGYLDDLMSEYNLGGPTPRPQLQRPAPLPPLPKPEEDSLLTGLLGKAVGGLGYVGGVLDKTFGGRAIRGGLAGKPRELLSVLPGSDTLGITNEDDRTSGDDLLKQAGILDGPGEKGTFELRDLAGPALEALLDPGTYASFGASALTDAGQLAKKAGTLEPSLLGRIKAGQGGLANFGLPFTDISGTVGTGPWAEKVAGKIGSTYDRAATSAPGRALSALFDKNVDNAITPVVQDASRATNAARQAAEPDVRSKIVGIARKLHDAGELNDSTSDVLRASLEGTASPRPGTATAGAVQDLKDFLAPMPGTEQALGMPSGELENYAPRQLAQFNQATKGYGRPQAATNPFHSNLIAREDILKGVPGETVGGINPWSLDPRWKDATISDLDKAKIARRDVLGMTAADEANRARLLTAKQALGGQLMTADEALLGSLNKQWDQGAGLADLFATMDPQHLEKGVPLFPNDIFQDVERRALNHVKGIAKADTLHDVLSKVAVPQAAAGDGAVNLFDMLGKAGLTDQSGAQSTLVQRLLAKGKTGPGLPAANQLFVPKEIAEDLTRYITGFTAPEAIKPLLNVFDSVAAMTKAGQTAIWPAKYARDMAQGIWQNFVLGARDPEFHALDPRSWFKPYQDAKAVLRDGGVVADANKIPGLTHLTPKEATKALADEMYAHKVAGPSKVSQAQDTLGALVGPGERYTLPGEQQDTLLDIAKGVKDAPLKDWDPRNIYGVNGRLQTTQPLAKAGSQTMEMIEDLNRGAAYVAKRRQGFEPAAAAAEATKAHYDFGNLAGFEKSVARRVMPFYSWTRQNLPAVLKDIAEQPGGKTAVALKGTNELRHDQGFVPDYVGEGLAVPIGAEQNGTQRFLGNLGLPFEDAFKPLNAGPNGAKRTAENLLAEANPLIKAPLELLSGKQFLSGRDLSDLYGPTGNTLADQVIMNSPLSRAYTTARTLMDPRKDWLTAGINTLSPAKLHDVDLDKQRQVAGRDLVEQYLHTSPDVKHFDQFYVRPEDQLNLSPAEVALLRLNKSLEQDARAAAKKRKGG